VGTYSFHPDAVIDLNDIWEYIARDSTNAANLVLDDLESAVNLLANNPLIGHQRPDLSSRPTRFWLVHSYLIAYIPEQPIIVTAILHGRRHPKIMAAILRKRN
jgi:plasmid stabilization system protein ParE